MNLFLPTDDLLITTAQRRALERAAITAGRQPCLRIAPSSAPVRLLRDDRLPAEAYRISDASDGVTIAATDPNGGFYGLARWLRDPSWRGTAVPRCDVRGVYLATHFDNFYQAAPLQEVTDYLGELALWGANTVGVWFDMHTYRGLADPAAQAMIGRLRAILAAARAVGLKPALLFLANEGYANSPPSLRADWTAQNGYHAPPQGHYHVELCPARPGAMDLILEQRRAVLAAFADLDLRYLCLWPYDQGGCTCGRCAPWGANGFLRLVPPLAALGKEMFPSARLIVSTWYFDRFIRGEWERFAAAFDVQGSRCDALLVEAHGRHVPAAAEILASREGLALLNFPEISMHGMFP